MYGHHVHQAVIENSETESGITIYYPVAIEQVLAQF